MGARIYSLDQWRKAKVRLETARHYDPASNMADVLRRGAAYYLARVELTAVDVLAHVGRRTGATKARTG